MSEHESKEKKIIYRAKIDDFYKQFDWYKPPIYNHKDYVRIIPKLRRDLKKIGVNVHYIKWNYWMSRGDDIEVFFEKNPDVALSNYLLFTERKLYLPSREEDGFVNVIHDIAPDLVDNVNLILQKHFPNRTIGKSKSICTMWTYGLCRL